MTIAVRRSVRGPSLHLLRTVQALLLVGAVVSARAGAQSGTSADSNRQRTELNVQSTDGGVYVPEGMAARQTDAGVINAVVPPELTAPSPAPYPEELKAAPVSGVVHLEILIDENGAVTEVAVAEGAHPAMDREAVAAAQRLGFKPATLNGQPVSVRLRYSYEFVAPPPPAPERIVGTIRGQVRQKGTRDPLVNANVLPAEGEAVPVDEKGQFTVSLPPGEHVLRVRAPGHKEAQFGEVVKAGETLEVVYRLEAEFTDPYVTIVRDQREREEVSRHSLSAQEIHEVPGTMGDPFRVVMLLPGVSTMASGLSYPVVRGSQPAATGYFIDGIQVPFLFHMGVGHAVIHPDVIETIDFFPGSPPVDYGRFLGGVVDGQLARPEDDRLRASAYADLINAGGRLEVPLEETGTTVTLAGRYSYTGWLIEQVANVGPTEEYEPVLDFWDYFGRVEQKLPNGARLRVLALGARDAIGVDARSEDGIDAYLQMQFHRIEARYQQALPVGLLEASLLWGHDSVGMEGRQDNRLIGDYSLRNNMVRGRVQWAANLLPQLEVSATGDVEHRRGRNTLTVGLGADDSENTAFTEPLTLATLTSLALQARWKPTPEWTVAGGVRGDIWHLVPGLNRFSGDPRATVRFAPTDTVTLKAGTGLLHQAPTILLNVPVMDTALLRYGLQEAITTDVGAEWKFLPGFELSADVYYTHFTRALELDLQQVFQNLRTQGLLGRQLATWGRAYGMELMLRHPIGNNWFGWISYSLQRATRYEEYVPFDDQQEPGTPVREEIPFAFDQTHVLHAVLSYQFPGDFTVGVGLQFNTGRPESGRISTYTKREWTDPGTGLDSWRFVSRNELDRLPPFFRLDARISKKWSYDDFQLEAYLDVLNVGYSKEILGYNYLAPAPGSESYPREKQPIELPVIIPMLGLKGSY